MELNDKQIINLFYNEIVPGAAVGRVDCFFTYTILFDTNIEGKLIHKDEKININNTIKPILNIDNKEEFDDLLIKYAKLAKSFYKGGLFILENELKEMGIHKEKMILAFLWNNASFIDFNNPCEFLKRRISFLESNVIPSNTYDFSNIITNTKIDFIVEKDAINLETPYKLIIKIKNDEDMEFYFPEIKFGCYKNDIYVYAVQNYHINNNSLCKKLNRLFYKVGLSDNQEFNDITSSFLVCITLFISYMNNLGYRNFYINDFLPIRWNSKMLIYNNKRYKNEDDRDDDIEKYYDIQNNITQKLLFTFGRCAYEFDGIKIESVPSDNSSFLNINVSNEVSSKNEFLNNIFNFNRSGNTRLRK